MPLSRPAALPFVLLFAASAFASQALAAAMTRAERADHERQITADYKSDKSRCDKLGGVERNACLEKARGAERLARAELAYNATGSETDAGKLAVVRRDADYAFAKERCDARKGGDRETCIREAKAAHAGSTANGR